jgi:hypothetical protein
MGNVKNFAKFSRKQGPSCYFFSFALGSRVQGVGRGQTCQSARENGQRQRQQRGEAAAPVVSAYSTTQTERDDRDS